MKKHERKNKTKPGTKKKSSGRKANKRTKNPKNLRVTNRAQRFGGKKIIRKGTKKRTQKTQLVSKSPKLISRASAKGRKKIGVAKSVDKRQRVFKTQIIRSERGANTTGFTLPKNIEKKLTVVDSKEFDRVVKAYQSKNRPVKGKMLITKEPQPKGAGYKPPRGVILIMKGKKGKKVKEKAVVSPVTMGITPEAVKQFVKDELQKVATQYEEYLELLEEGETDEADEMDADNEYGMFDPQIITSFYIKYLY